MEFYGTIGPACAQLETLQRMVEAGMTGIRMNLSHGPLSAHKDWLDIIHAVGIPQLLIDLQGPELRIGTLPQPLVLKPGQSLRLGQGGVPCPAALVHAARPGQNLLLDDGRLLVQVAETDGAALQCTVVRGGTLQSRKSLAAPGLTVASPTLTEEDLQNLQLAGACGVTGVMLPFVRGAEDIRTLRRALEQADGLDKVFAHHITNKSGKYIVFCANKEHMDEMISHVPEWFAKVNAEVAVYEAYSDDPGTDKAFADFKADESDRLKLLFCIDMLNEGVHVEGISGVILFRPTISPIIYKQQIGRALTAGENSTPLILDVVNNFEGLCSIAGLQGEVQEAVYRLNANGEGNKIITERFKVVEQVHDCRVLFERLQASLSSSWDHYFSEASIYYAEHGNLNIPKRYTTPEGLSLGEWLTTQRRVRAGQIPGNLTEQQIARLDSIGMEWGNRNDAAWERGLEEARKFREQFGNLQVPAKYKTKDDYPLGKWINNARKRRNDGKLTEERIRQLDQLGMAWKVFDVRWEQGYALAAVYAQEYGNLDVPRDYKTADGKTLGRWIQNQELAYEQKKLSADQIKRLETIGMQWGSRYDRQWNEVYQSAKRYFEANGNLDVPVAYVSPEGYALGKWVRRQQYAYRNPEKSNAILSQERIELLDAIGMQWEKPDSWQHRYELAQEYKKQYGNLEIPAKYKTADGIWLSRWVYNQKRLLQSGLEKLSEEQKKKLKELLGYYVKISA